MTEIVRPRLDARVMIAMRVSSVYSHVELEVDSCGDIPDRLAHALASGAMKNNLMARLDEKFSSKVVR